MSKPKTVRRVHSGGEPLPHTVHPSHEVKQLHFGGVTLERLSSGAIRFKDMEGYDRLILDIYAPKLWEKIEEGVRRMETSLDNMSPRMKSGSSAEHYYAAWKRTLKTAQELQREVDQLKAEKAGRLSQENVNKNV